MKLTTKLGVLFCVPLMLLAGCATTGKKAKTTEPAKAETATEKTETAATTAPEADADFDEDADAPEATLQHSKHVALPDTSSKVMTVAQPLKYANLTAPELVRRMGNGINLGNTMEAYRGTSLTVGLDPTRYETAWGQPVTTQAMMDGYKKAGFDSVRIPVAWTNAMNYESGDYTIDTKYLDRVETIVNYALKAGLIVVFNDHWDGGWWGMFGSADMETRKDAMDLYTSMWTQIANRFKNYSDDVLFACANEELGPRFNDVNVAKDGGQLSEDEYYNETNIVTQAFVDLIRKTGGNNAKRFLVIPGINTNIASTCDERFIMPKDSTNEICKLIVEVHYYTPWSFCGDNASVNNWGTTKEVSQMNNDMEAMSDFVSNGYGVIIGEYMVPPQKDNSIKKGHTNWLNNFLDNCDLYDYCPMLWDTGGKASERYYGMYDRTLCKIYNDEIAKIYQERNYASQSKFTKEQIETTAQNNIDNRYDDAPELLSDNPYVGNADKSVAWIMYNSQDWGVTYSVGDQYNPDSKTDGLKPTDVEIKGEGTYTVGLDFTGIAADGSGTARSFAFSALAISNGETLFPGYVIDIKEIAVNGKPIKLTAKPYTTSDDKHCTRVNIYNEWVKTPPEDARTVDGSLTGAKATIVTQGDPALLAMKTLTITFYWGPKK